LESEVQNDDHNIIPATLTHYLATTQVLAGLYHDG
jgi:hypothetical protein